MSGTADASDGAVRGCAVETLGQIDEDQQVLEGVLYDRDPANRALLAWEPLDSVPPPTAETRRNGPRVDAAQGGVDMLELLNPAISAAKLSSEGARYAPALKLASQIIAASSMPRREVVLISDFQKVGWANRNEISFPKGTTITPIDLGGP